MTSIRHKWCGISENVELGVFAVERPLSWSPERGGPWINAVRLMVIAMGLIIKVIAS